MTLYVKRDLNKIWEDGASLHPNRWRTLNSSQTVLCIQLICKWGSILANKTSDYGRNCLKMLLHCDFRRGQTSPTVQDHERLSQILSHSVAMSGWIKEETSPQPAIADVQPNTRPKRGFQVPRVYNQIPTSLSASTSQLAGSYARCLK